MSDRAQGSPGSPHVELFGRRFDTFFGHPWGLSTLFFTEMWERFSYYGMRALLILFMTASVADGGLGWGVAKAGAIYGLYTSLVYLSNLPGGWIADRIMGHRRSVLVGGIVIAAGHFTIAVPGVATFYVGLLLIILGTGLLKPNISTMVGHLYEEGDERRDSGFTIFYMGINIGAFVAPLVTAFLGERIDWHYGFGAAGVGMVLGLIQYVWGGKFLGDAGREPTAPAEEQDAARFQLRWSLAGVAVVGAILTAMHMAGVIELTAVKVSNAFGVILPLIVVGFFAWLFLGGDWTETERKRLWAIVVLFLAASLFWSAFEQAGSTLNIFAEEHTARGLMGFELPAGWFQSLNPMYIILLAPVFSWLWLWLADRNREPSSPAKFSLGLVLLGAGFLVLFVGAASSAAGGGASPMWLVVTYFLHTTGELCLSPVGLSAMTKLAPARVAGLMMGVWFMATAVGNFIGGRVAGLLETLPPAQLFLAVAGITVTAGLLMAIAVKWIRGLMSGIH